MLNEKQQKIAAKNFAELWHGTGDEKSDTQRFWMALLSNIFGLEHPENFIEFEKRVKLGNVSFIDAYIDKTKVLIEQKGIDIDLRKPIRQSDNSLLTPFGQAKRYAAALPFSQRPRRIVVCNFRQFDIYDMEKPDSEPETILLENLATEYYRLQFLVDTSGSHIKKEMEVSIAAGKIVGQLYDEILNQYHDKTSEKTLRSLNILCVRLVFCLYAEDAGIFGRHAMFHDYLDTFPTERLRKAIIELFEVLNTPPEKRDPYLEKSLAEFPYVNGGLFAQHDIEIPNFNDNIRRLLLEKASDDFDWSMISPTIFGALFESTLNPETRRSGGMHYTSIENIHKVIDPLFLDSLNSEFDSIIEIGVAKTRTKKLVELQNKIASLTFLDPACGSGNFLTETYICLRRLENKIIAAIYKGQIHNAELFNPIKVGIHQFYGIEINDFAVTVATTALWIAESQMMAETESIVNMDLDFLPLKSYTNIAEGNALQINWEEVVAADKLNYIIGNPPFVGARLMNPAQKSDLIAVFGKDWKNVGNLDYVSGWYKKAADLMRLNKNICTALVSTNSISQGEQVANLWANLMHDGLKIQFAYRTFRWDSEASDKAHVHCVIIGFGYKKQNQKYLFDENSTQIVENINAYLTDTDDIFIYSRSTPICDIPNIGIGNKPIDGGNYLFDKKEMEDFISIEPESEKYFRPWYGAVEYINNQPRYCLWLGDCSPAELRKMPMCMKRVENVRRLRNDSKSAGTRKLAERPTRFHVENMPNGTFILIPRVSSEKRLYIPMGFLCSPALCSDAVHIIPDATLYHFGVLISSVHMAWMRTVCGRLKSDYRYSKDVVYNNFPWASPSEQQIKKIEQTAQAILDVRNLYPDCSLADLYDDATMPIELRNAHQANDKAVMQAYGFATTLPESEIVRHLFAMYVEMTKNS